MKDTLNIGDTVSWRGAWGTQPAQDAVVRDIIKCEAGTKYGNSTSEIKWDSIDGRNIIVDLTNGSWAYGNQITQLPQDNEK